MIYFARNVEAYARGEFVVGVKSEEQEFLENAVVAAFNAAGFPAPQAREYKFAKEAGYDRLWKADFAYIGEEHPRPVLLEVEGGIFGRKGRHNKSPTGFDKDCEKYSYASSMGYTVVRVTEIGMRDGRAFRYMAFALGVSVDKDTVAKGVAEFREQVRVARAAKAAARAAPGRRPGRAKRVSDRVSGRDGGGRSGFKIRGTHVALHREPRAGHTRNKGK
jgi:hypothetical protein